MSLFAFLRPLPLLLVALASAGCHVHSGPAYAEPVVVRTAYEPVYYRSHVVYFDDAGAPYYHDHGRVIFVGRADPRYGVYTSHYASHRHAYRAWATSHPGHRRGPAYSHGPSYSHGPRGRTPARPAARPSGRPRHTHR